MPLTLDADRIHKIDTELQEWRQGDLALEEDWFVYVGASDNGEQPKMVQTEGGDGLIVVTQTCDLIRSCANRPFVEVSPLVEVNPTDFSEVIKAMRPKYAYVPKMKEQRLVADLDRVMTVEKEVVASWSRTSGFETDSERRLFAEALGRKRERFPFPDDFQEYMRPLQDRLKEKHDKQTSEGKALRALRQIRVRAAPSWDAKVVTITFSFIPNSDSTAFEGIPWNQYLDPWAELLETHPKFKCEVEIVSLEDLSAQDYVDSDPLDLDHLSAPKE